MYVEVSRPVPNSMNSTTAGQMRRRDDLAVVRLIADYDAHGGLATSDEVVLLMRPYWRQPVSTLAKWIVNRQLVAFSWRDQLLLPLFQFARPRMAPRAAVSDSALELGEYLEDQGVARWFVEANRSLHQATPVDVLLSDPDSVVEAARATRVALADERARGAGLDLAHASAAARRRA